VRRGQTQVEKEDVGPLGGEPRLPLGGVAGGDHREAAPEGPGELLEKEGVALDDQDPGKLGAGLRHGSGRTGGKESWTTVPPPGRVSIRTRPPWCRTISLAVTSPSPTPS